MRSSSRSDPLVSLYICEAAWGNTPTLSYDSTIKAFSDYCSNTQVAIQALYISEEPPVNHGYSKKSKDQESRNLCLTRLESYQLIIPLH